MNKDHECNHEHGHNHDHDHSHDHEHNHSHDHDHSTPDISASKNNQASSKDVALLTYMLAHNKQHARELAETGSRLADAGFREASELIEEAIHYFDHANESLDKAVLILSDA